MALPAILIRFGSAVMPWVSRSRLLRPLIGSRGFLGVGRALTGVSAPPGGGRFLLGGLRLPSQTLLLGPGASAAVANSGRLLTTRSFIARITHVARQIITKTAGVVLAALPKIKAFIRNPKFKKVLDGVFLAWMFADILGIFDKKGDLSEVEQHKVDNLLLQLIPAAFSAQLTPVQRTISEYLVYNEDKCDYRTLVDRIYTSVIMTSELVDPEISSECFFIYKMAQEVSSYPTSYLDAVLDNKAFKKHFKDAIESAAELKDDEDINGFVDELFANINLKEMHDATKKNLVLIYILATV